MDDETKESIKGIEMSLSKIDDSLRVLTAILEKYLPALFHR